MLVLFGPDIRQSKGGVSVFLERLKGKMLDSKVVHLYWKSSLKEFNSALRVRMWHVNVSSRLHLYVAYLVLFFGKKVLIHLHNDRVKINEVLLNFVGNESYVVAFVSHKLFECSGIRSSKKIYLPAYIPAKVYQYREFASSSKKQVVFSLWKYEKGFSEEVYGLDLLVLLIKKFTDEVDWHIFIGDNYKGLSEYLMTSGVDISKIDFKVSQELVPYLADADILLRLNRRDGYGLVVHEALDNGCWALASNCCVRTDQTVLFETGDIADLEEKFSYLLSCSRSPKLQSNFDCFNELQKIYKFLNETTDTKTW